MICEACRQAAEIVTGPLPPDRDRAIELHELECPGGTWCCCQHYVEEPVRDEAESLAV